MGQGIPGDVAGGAGGGAGSGNQLGQVTRRSAVMVGGVGGSSHWLGRREWRSVVMVGGAAGSRPAGKVMRWSAVPVGGAGLPLVSGGVGVGWGGGATARRLQASRSHASIHIMPSWGHRSRPGCFRWPALKVGMGQQQLHKPKSSHRHWKEVQSLLPPCMVAMQNSSLV